MSLSSFPGRLSIGGGSLWCRAQAADLTESTFPLDQVSLGVTLPERRLPRAAATPIELVPLWREVANAKLEVKPVVDVEQRLRIDKQAIRCEETQKNLVSVTKVVECPLLVARSFAVDMPPAGIENYVSRFVRRDRAFHKFRIDALVRGGHWSRRRVSRCIAGLITVDCSAV